MFVMNSTQLRRTRVSRIGKGQGCSNEWPSRATTERRPDLIGGGPRRGGVPGPLTLLYFLTPSRFAGMVREYPHDSARGAGSGLLNMDTTIIAQERISLEEDDLDKHSTEPVLYHQCHFC